MRVFAVAMVLALLTGPVFAQGINIAPQERQLTNEQIEKNKAIDEAYRESIKKIPDQKPSNDPWGNVRGAGAAQAQAAPTRTPQHKPRPQKTTKTQSTAR